MNHLVWLKSCEFGGDGKDKNKTTFIRSNLTAANVGVIWRHRGLKLKSLWHEPVKGEVCWGVVGGAWDPRVRTHRRPGSVCATG